jgi:hypothetical protein
MPSVSVIVHLNIDPTLFDGHPFKRVNFAREGIHDQAIESAAVFPAALFGGIQV